jgi:uncharacterized glyoxalase superfamily protein PhnB
MPILLGLKLIEPYGAAYARLRSSSGQTTIALHLMEPGKSPAGDGGVRLYLETRHLDKLCKHLEAVGVKFSEPPKMMPWGWRHAYLEDPNGHEVSLYTAGRKGFQKSVMPKPQ